MLVSLGVAWSSVVDSVGDMQPFELFTKPIPQRAAKGFCAAGVAIFWMRCKTTA